MSNLQDYPDILNVKEVGEILRIGRNKVFQLLRSGELKGFRTGKMWRIPKSSIEEYINANINTRG